MAERATLARMIGKARAFELLWTGRVVNAAEAERIGLVNRVVPLDWLMPETLGPCALDCAQPFEAVRAYKRTVYQCLSMTLTACLDMVSSHTSVLRDTPEHRGKVAAFLERKRGGE